MYQEPERVTLLSSFGESGNLAVKDCAPADEIGRLCSNSVIATELQLGRFPVSGSQPIADPDWPRRRWVDARLDDIRKDWEAALVNDRLPPSQAGILVSES
jgi:hypothetical protein